MLLILLKTALLYSFKTLCIVISPRAGGKDTALCCVQAVCAYERVILSAGGTCGGDRDAVADDCWEGVEVGSRRKRDRTVTDNVDENGGEERAGWAGYIDAGTGIDHTRAGVLLRVVEADQTAVEGVCETGFEMIILSVAVIEHSQAWALEVGWVDCLNDEISFVSTEVSPSLSSAPFFLAAFQHLVSSGN